MKTKTVLLERYISESCRDELIRGDYMINDQPLEMPSTSRVLDPYYYPVPIIIAIEVTEGNTHAE